MKPRSQSKRHKLTIKHLGPSRRRFLASTAAVTAASAASWPLILTPGKAKASDQVVIALWGGSFTENVEKAYLKPFTAETGIPVLAAGPPDGAKVKAMVKSGNIEWDIVLPLFGVLVKGEEDGYWESLDTNIVDTSGMFPGAVRDQAMAFEVIAGGIAWNNDINPGDKHPTDWAGFFDAEKYPGRRGPRNRAFETLEYATLSLGVPPDQVYPIDVDRAFARLDEWKPHVSHFIKATQNTIKFLQQDEADFTYTYNGRFYAALNAGIPLGFSYETNLILLDYLSVVKGTKHKDAAMRLVDFIARADRQAEMANLMAYAPTKLAALDMVNPEVKKYFPDLSNPRNLTVSPDWWGANSEEVEKRYKEWMLI
jgi:putative spermidine/putrescine transport system substrate-binding protein